MVVVVEEVLHDLQLVALPVFLTSEMLVGIVLLVPEDDSSSDVLLLITTITHQMSVFSSYPCFIKN